MGYLNNFSKITCRCNRYITKEDDLYRVSYYKLRTPVEKRTSNNERIIDEVFFCYVCPRCDRDVVFIKKRAINSAGNIKAILPVTLIGKDAADYLERTKDIRTNLTNTLHYTEYGRFVKCGQISYFKAINETHQRPRYLNESGYSGEKIESKVKVLSMV